MNHSMEREGQKKSAGYWIKDDEHWSMFTRMRDETGGKKCNNAPGGGGSEGRIVTVHPFVLVMLIDFVKLTGPGGEFFVASNAIILWFWRNLSERLSCDLSTHDARRRNAHANDGESSALERGKSERTTINIKTNSRVHPRPSAHPLNRCFLPSAGAGSETKNFL